MAHPMSDSQSGWNIVFDVSRRARESRLNGRRQRVGQFSMAKRVRTHTSILVFGE